MESVGWHGPVLDDLARHRLIRHLIGMEVTDLVHATDQRLRESGVRSVEELQRLPYNVIGFSEDMHRRNRQLKDFLYANLYRHYRVVRMAVKAERIISDLFHAYRAGAGHPARSRAEQYQTNAAWSAPSAITSPA